MTQNDKITAMVEALYPQIKARLEEDYVLSPRFRPKSAKTKEKIYIPELDYLVSLYRLRNEVKQSLLKDNKVVASKNSVIPGQKYYCTGATGVMDDEWVDLIIIPTQTLLQLNATHGIDIRRDYRINPAATFYCGYITDHQGREIRGAKSCYEIVLSRGISQEVVKATHDEWMQLTEEDKARRIVHWTTLEEVMDVMLQGQIDPARQVDNWRVLIDRFGNGWSYEEAEELRSEAEERISPRKIAATWMHNQI